VQRDTVAAAALTVAVAVTVTAANKQLWLPVAVAEQVREQLFSLHTAQRSFCATYYTQCALHGSVSDD
jgi:hypothetical protein